jgi:alpha,alpha-trehalase
VCRYYANWTAPRPESYREDAELARNVTGTDSPDNPAAAALYRELASGAESGWDYSSRWFADMTTMKTLRTTKVSQQQRGDTLLAQHPH